MFLITFFWSENVYAVKCVPPKNYTVRHNNMKAGEINHPKCLCYKWLNLLLRNRLCLIYPSVCQHDFSMTL